MKINLFYGNGYRIVKLIPIPPRCHPIDEQ